MLCFEKEIAALTSSIERLQCENTQMASQIQEMHSTKERMVQEYDLAHVVRSIFNSNEFVQEWDH